MIRSSTNRLLSALLTSLLCGCANTMNDAGLSNYTSYLVHNPQETQRILNSLAEYQKKQAANLQQQRISQNKSIIFSEKNAVALGNKNSEAAIVMFTDPNCKYCLKFFNEILNNRNSGEFGIKLIVKETPMLGAKSINLSNSLSSLSAEDYVQFYRIWSQGTTQNPEDILKGLKSAKHLGNIQAPNVSPILDNLKLAQSLEISSTPTFIYNDRVYRGYSEEILELLTKF